MHSPNNIRMFQRLHDGNFFERFFGHLAVLQKYSFDDTPNRFMKRLLYSSFKISPIFPWAVFLFDEIGLAKIPVP